MKVLLTTDWYKPAINGVVTSICSLEAGLAALGHDVRVLTLSGDRRSHTDGNVTYIGSIGVGEIYPGARLKTALGSRQIRELIDWKPDIVHSQCEFSTFLPARKIARRCGCPLVHTYHTVYEDFTRYFSPSVRLGKHMAALFSKRALSHAQAVVVPTEKVKRMLQSYGVKPPICVQPSGLELEPFAQMPDEAALSSLRKRLGLAEKDRVLLYLGRLAQEKNVGELLTLLSQAQNPHLKLLLVGDGPYRPRLEAQARALRLGERVLFAGMIPPSDVAQYYRLGDVFVSASRSETQGLTYLEAMAAGLPLLCRDDPCLEGVIKGGVTGFAYQSADAFHADLRALLDDDALRRSMGGAARKAAFERFSSMGFAEGVMKVYQEALRKKEAKSAIITPESAVEPG